MRKRILFTVICLIATLFLFLNGYGLWQILQNYIHSQEEKVREWQREHQTFDDDLPAPVTSTFPPRPVEIEWVNQDPSTSTWAPSTTRIPVATTTTRIRITTSSKATSTYSIPESTSTTTTSTTEASSTTWEPSTEAYSTWAPTTTSTVTSEPSTEASTFSSSTTTWEPSTSSTEASSSTTTSTPSPTPTTSSSTTSSTTTTTTVPPETTTTARIRTWTYPTRRPPPIFDPERHRYGQDRLHHHHHHHHHTSTTSTTSSSTTTTTTTTETPSTTTRILVTTPRYPASQSNSIYDRITIPASSSYRNPYIHKIEVTSSTYRTPDRHHHHHHHNRTHIDIHSHHRHHLGYPQFPYPVIPSVLYPTTSTPTSTKASTSTTTTSEVPEAPETTTHRHHHHHHHHHHHSTTTVKPTTTTRQSELDRWGFVESVEEVASEEEASSTTTTTTTTEAPTTTTTPPEPVTMTPRGRHRQPEPTQAPTKRVERDVTLVTGFLDIGRGEWDIYRRPLETYHKFMETLLTLENNFVVFTDESSYDFVIRTRTKLNLIDKTKVYKITLQDLPLYSYINEARKIIDDELKNETFYRTVADLDMKTHPESISAEYNIVVNSKTHFLHNVTMENPFDSEHFVWLDAGYGHANENYFPYSYNWRPALPDGKISLIKVTPYFDAVGNYDLKKLYRKNVALLSGGFIAGDKHSIGQLHSIIHRKFIQLIYQNHVDDDQTLLTLAVNSYPHLFHIVLGDWFDAFRLFASDPEVQMG